MSAPELERGTDFDGGGTPSSDGVRDRLSRGLGRHSTRDAIMQSEVPPSAGDGTVMHGRRDAEPLRELAHTALRGALLDDVRVSDRDGQVRVLLRNACEVARAREIHVEQVLILLKEVWQEIPQHGQINHRDAQAVLAHVVSLCIEEYYAPKRST
jgi:hypothetical protein